jgi:coiled-coil domain-containing protein 55
MTHFYRQLLEESEQKHEATVAATDKRVIGPQGPSVNLTIVKPPGLSSMPDAELARLAREEGKDVELNDDNQIVDKRELLSAGLNLSLPNTRFSGLRNPANNSKNVSQSLQTHRAVGTAASRREINERKAREIQQQLEAEKHRTAQESQNAADQALQRIIAKRNNEDDIEDARSRYLDRKRKKMEEEKSKDPSDGDIE